MNLQHKDKCSSSQTKASGSQLSTLQSKADFHTLRLESHSLQVYECKLFKLNKLITKRMCCILNFATRGATAHQCSLLLQVDVFINIHLKNYTFDTFILQ